MTVVGIRFATVYLSADGRPLTLEPVVVDEILKTVLGLSWYVLFQTTWIRPPVRVLAATSALVTRVITKVEAVLVPAVGEIVSVHAGLVL